MTDWREAESVFIHLFLLITSTKDSHRPIAITSLEKKLLEVLANSLENRQMLLAVTDGTDDSHLSDRVAAIVTFHLNSPKIQNGYLLTIRFSNSRVNTPENVV